MPRRFIGTAEVVRRRAHEHKTGGGGGWFRVQFDGTAERCDGFFKAFELEQRISHAGMGHREIRVCREHGEVRLDRLGVALPLAQRFGRDLQRRGVAAGGFPRAAKVCVRFLGATRVIEQEVQIQQRRGVFRNQPQGAEKTLFRLCGSAQGLQGAAGHSVQRLKIGRIRENFQGAVH